MILLWVLKELKFKENGCKLDSNPRKIWKQSYLFLVTQFSNKLLYERFLDSGWIVDLNCKCKMMEFWGLLFDQYESQEFKSLLHKKISRWKELVNGKILPFYFRKPTRERPQIT
jgi:hypothetical protein